MVPKEIIYCNNCVQSNQRPNSAVEYQNSITEKKRLNLNKKCDVCLFVEKKKKINWKEREEELIELCNKFRKKDGTYDCIVPAQEAKTVFMHHIF